MKGIDISNCQGSINFAKVKADGVEVVYIKATEGLTFNDPYFNQNYANAKAQGLKVGFYHYLRNNDVAAEAAHFLSVTSGYVADCLYAIDAEDTCIQNSTVSARVRSFADILISKGLQVCLYTGKYFYGAYLNETVKNLPLWIANYGVSDPGVTNYAGWQYSDKGSVNGISGNVDSDTFNNSILIISKVEVRKVKDLVVVGNAVDKRAAEYLADFLLCPIIDASLPFDYSTVTNVYCIGGTPTTNGKVGWTTAAKKIISGSDRYDTCSQTLAFIKNGAK